VQAGHAVHKTWRGHNKEGNLGEDADKRRYLDFQREDFQSQRFDPGSKLNAFTLMTNHAHELFAIEVPKLFSNHMRRHHARYGQYFNQLKERSGKVAEDRPHTTLLESEEQQMIATFYIHANPLRAGMVKDMRNYVWSTHRLYAFGLREPWMQHVSFPQWYLKLGRTFEQRQRVYRKLFARYLANTDKKSQRFLKRRFFGSPLWVHRQEAAVRLWRKEHRGPPE
jgi:hypothetical protein